METSLWSLKTSPTSSWTSVTYGKEYIYQAILAGTNFPIGKNTDNILNITVNLNIGIEGFWNGTIQIADTVTAELRSSTSPYNVIDEAKTVITTGTGYGTFEYISASSGSYYIVVKHRNSLETWSATPVAMSSGGNYNYSFTSSDSQAFGNNTTLKLGRYCNYSGDVNQDGTIDGSDFSQVDNEAAVSNTGYVDTDLDGNGIVDGSDFSIVDNNSFNSVSVITP